MCAISVSGCYGLSFSNGQRSTHCSCSSAVFYCVVSGAFSSWFVWDCVPPPSPPIIYLGSWGLSCSHVGSFYLPVVVFFLLLFLYFSGFHYDYYYYYYYFTIVYFHHLPLNLFQCEWCPCLCCLSLFCLVLCWGGGLVAGLWILLAGRVVPSCRGWVAGQP